MNIRIEESWKVILKEEFEKSYFQTLVSFIKSEYSSKKIFPPARDIFRAFDLCPFENVRVVILGQDPYHTPGVANGLSFSVNPDQRIPPSLKNIYKELKSDLNKEIPTSGDLTKWAHEGVLLLNATLTVQSNQAGSHQNKGWEEFTDAVIKKLSDSRENLVFILWGSFAKRKGELISKDKHLIIESAHPSPFSAERGFFGSKPFSRANDYLIAHKMKPINW